MITRGDCSCTDTEPSNLTSLCSDDVPSAVNSDVNTVCVETVDREKDAAEKSKGTSFFDKYYDGKLENNFLIIPQSIRFFFFSNENITSHLSKQILQILPRVSIYPKCQAIDLFYLVRRYRLYMPRCITDLLRARTGRSSIRGST